MLKKLIQNKSLPFLILRYITYLVTFVKINLLAAKLGVHDYGIWGFIKLIWQYLSFITIGIHFAVNVLIASNKGNHILIKRFSNSSISIAMVLSVMLIGLSIFINLLDTNLFPKYEISGLFIAVISIGMIKNINVVNINIDRNFNRLYTIGLYYILSEVLILPVLFLTSQGNLLSWVVYATLFIEIIFLLAFIIKRSFRFSFEFKADTIVLLVKRGVKLLLYNYSLIFMFLSVRTIVAHFYTVEEFGEYSFVNSIVDALFVAFSSIIWVFFPKMITKFSSSNDNEVLPAIDKMRQIYIPLLFLSLLCVGFSVFVVHYFFPDYNNFQELFIFMLIALGIRDYAFGFNTLIIAKGKEIVLAKTALVSIIVNTVITVILGWMHSPLRFIPVITIIASFLYSIAAIRKSYSVFSTESRINLLKTDWRVLVPIIFVLVLLLSDQFTLITYSVVFVLFVLLNLQIIKKAINNSIVIFTHKND